MSAEVSRFPLTPIRAFYALPGELVLEALERANAGEDPMSLLSELYETADERATV
jgi:hypothetical protein